MSPTSRSLKLLRDRGYLADIVERRIPYSNVTKDLFGIIDIVAIREGETLAVQATSGSNVASRVRKVSECESLSLIRSAGWRVFVFGWRKNAENRWVCREVDLSQDRL